MAYNGDWRKALTYIGEAYADVSSVRDSIEGERNIQGFFLAYLSLTGLYLTAPEVEVAHGYCDFFLMPDFRRYDVRHSYIIELKYLSINVLIKRAQSKRVRSAEREKRRAKPNVSVKRAQSKRVRFAEREKRGAKPKDFPSRSAAQWTQAEEQIRRYAAAPRVLSMTAGTTLHKVVLQFEGYTLRRIDEVVG